ncbi:VOC family protein [Mailhella massiliensis]|uniref:VOC family protein n=1 Tax=Mailhella massiliensis TaxID=1903261 RepID=UPI00097D2CE9|nr:VOC family protein [Mailhella massiliensis]
MSVCKGLHHVAMAIQDRETYERTVAFYRDVIGLPLLRTWRRGERHITMLDFGNSILEIVFGAEGAGTGVFAHIALKVDRPEDVDAMLERALACGCTPSRPAESALAEEETCGGGRQAGTFHLRNAFCIGFAGESLEFFCEY